MLLQRPLQPRRDALEHNRLDSISALGIVRPLLLPRRVRRGWRGFRGSSRLAPQARRDRVRKRSWRQSRSWRGQLRQRRRGREPPRVGGLKFGPVGRGGEIRRWIDLILVLSRKKARLEEVVVERVDCRGGGGGRGGMKVVERAGRELGDGHRLCRVILDVRRRGRHEIHQTRHPSRWRQRCFPRASSCVGTLRPRREEGRHGVFPDQVVP